MCLKCGKLINCDYEDKWQGKYENGEGRFNICWDPPDHAPYGEMTLGIVDEEAGGIVAYVGSEALADQLIALLKTTE